MARVNASIEHSTPADQTNRIVVTAAIIAALHFGSEILIPIALAILLSFALAPAVKLLHKLGLGRVLPVALTVIVTFLLLAALTGLIATQVRDLSSGFPRYEATVVHKIQTLKGLGNSAGLRKLEDAVAKFSKAIGRVPVTAEADSAGSQGNAPGPHATLQDQPDQAPLSVQVVQPAMGPLEATMLVASPLLHPLSTAVIVLIFVIFILLQREDLRNRAIRLFGANDLQKATAAINDGARRLSRYLLTQSAINAAAGVIVGVALWLIGVPSPILLGILFAFARFVPYVGPAIGAALPLLLATAVDPGWSMVLWTAAALAIVEVVVGQAVEPLLYGHHTGLSPIAVVISATFWTVLWGPVGLLLATPLTVCLVVLGRHVEHLAFLDVLLGDRPPLSPAETFYQRLLANDPVEAADQAQRCLGDMSVAQYYDEVALPGLLMAQDDAAQGRLDHARQAAIGASAMEVIDDLEQDALGEAGQKGRGGFLGFGRKVDEHRDAGLDDLVAERAPDALRVDGSVLCIGARGPLDDAVAAMLAQVLTGHGIGAVAESHSRLAKAELPQLDVDRLRLICLCALDGSSPAFLRFVLRRLRRRVPHVEILVGAFWRRNGHGETDAEIDEAIRNEKVATLLDAVRFCFGSFGPAAEAQHARAETAVPLAAAS